MELKQDYIDSLSPNASAAANGKALIGKFAKLCKSEDETLLFGECKGSGKKPYICSYDFIVRENPVPRCSCPSRQIPCKHALGLLYAYAAGKPFETDAIPEDILAKRDKIEKRLENKEKKTEELKSGSPKKTEGGKASAAKKTAAVKKINLQLEGIAAATLLFNNILQTGIAGIDAAAVKGLEQQAKALGNYHINGIQNAFNRLLIDIKAQTEQTYDATIASALYMSALLKQSKTYLTDKIANEDTLLTKDTKSAIEEQIGHVWKLEELLESGMYIENAALMQLAFYSYGDDSRREFVDAGFYFCLNDGQIYLSLSYRPYKALKYIKEDDSRFEMTETPELYIYPGDMNPRVRWNKYTMRAVEAADMQKVKSAAQKDYATVIKSVKNQIKSPLADKNPVALLYVTDMHITTDDSGARLLHITDEKGVSQVLLDNGYVDVSTVPMLTMLDKNGLVGNALLVMFVNDAASGVLAAKPLSIVTDDDIVRLVY